MQLRSPPAVRLSFLKLKGFALLANQLREHAVTANIANCLFGLLCNINVRLENGSARGLTFISCGVIASGKYRVSAGYV